jgi:hypothetical protein
MWSALFGTWLTPQVRKLMITVEYIKRHISMFNKASKTVNAMLVANSFFTDSLEFNPKWTFKLWAHSNFKKMSKAIHFWKHSLGNSSFIFPEVLRVYFTHKITEFRRRFHLLPSYFWLGDFYDDDLTNFLKSLPVEDGVPVSNIKTPGQIRKEIFIPWKRTRKFILNLRCDGYVVVNYVILGRYYIKLVITLQHVLLFAGWKPIPFVKLQKRPAHMFCRTEDSVTAEYKRRYGFHPGLGVQRHNNYLAIAYKVDDISRSSMGITPDKGKLSPDTTV